MSTTRAITTRLGRTAVEDQVIGTDFEKMISKDDLSAAEALLAFLHLDDNAINANYKMTHRNIIAKLVRILRDFTTHLPLQQPQLNVISLGYGVPDDYLALKILLGKINPACKINYIGVDIDGAQNQTITSEFKNFPEVSIVTADACDYTTLFEKLNSTKDFPNHDFDLIFMRHPEILLPLPFFTKMIRETIPFLSHQTTRVFFSTYNVLEEAFLNNILQIENYSELEENRQFIPSCFGVRNNRSKMLMEPETYSTLMECKGTKYILNHASQNDSEDNAPQEASRKLGSSNLTHIF